MNILIPIETASREIPYKVFLSALLSQKGFNCYIGTKTSILNLIKNSKEYIYLDKGFHDGVSQNFYRLIKENNGLIYSLDEEGAVDYDDNRILKHRYAQELFNFADHVFFWGRRQYNVVQKNIKFHDRVTISGHPRFQLLSESFHKIYRSEVSVLRQKHGKYVLFNTNMSFGNNINGEEFILRNYGDRFTNLEQTIAFDKEKCSLIVKCIRELALSSSEKVILRPHPEEELSFYNDQFKDLSNVEVIYEGSVVPWILGSEYIVHPDCTTAIEAVFLGKKAFSLLPNNYDPSIVTVLPLDVSTKLDSEKDFIPQIKLELCNRGVPIELIEHLENNFSSKKDSLTHMVNEFTKVFNPNAQKMPNTVLWVQMAKNRAKRLFNLVAPKSMRRENKLAKNKTKELKIAWINELLSYFIEVNESIVNVKSKKIHSELFLIQKKK